PSTATLAIDGTNPSPNVSAPLDTGTVSIDLSGVSSPGSLTIATSITPLSQGTPLGITTLSTNYQVSNAGVSFTSAKSCFPYSPADVVAAGVPEASLRLYHYQGTIWVDVTFGAPDLTNHVICGNTSSFSPFEIGSKGTFQVFLPEVVDQSGPSGAAK
ncbi:MAG TPA: hypothetical protein VMW65_08080, partial [Chloroflexota bacterium]|nr:hypothetical protein [Chloroflexota bacterium]